MAVYPRFRLGDPPVNRPGIRLHRLRQRQSVDDGVDIGQGSVVVMGMRVFMGMGVRLFLFPVPKGLPAPATGAYRPVLTENAPLERFPGARCPCSLFS
jgi:hypothetical protein